MKSIEERWDWENAEPVRKAGTAERISWLYGALGACAMGAAVFLIPWHWCDNAMFTAFVWGALALLGGLFATPCLFTAVALQAGRYATARQRAQMRSKRMFRAACVLFAIGVGIFVKFFYAWPHVAEWSSLSWRPLALLVAVGGAIALADRAHRTHLKWNAIERDLGAGKLSMAGSSPATRTSLTPALPRISATAPVGMTTLLSETEEHSTYRTHVVSVVEVARVPHPRSLVPLAIENARRLAWARDLALAGVVLGATASLCLVGVG